MFAILVLASHTYVKARPPQKMNRCDGLVCFAGTRTDIKMAFGSITSCTTMGEWGIKSGGSNAYPAICDQQGFVGATT